jgi:branched-chain amino acid aminotransferase/4-amino-4-deoxychorismate lyase
MVEALAGVEAPRAAVRLTLTCGSGGRGLDRPAAPELRLFAAAAPSARPEGPARLVTAAVRRNETSPASRLKTLSYLDNVLARDAARAAGADEALMLNTRGEAACAAAANIFWVDDGRLITPALACGALAGIMRAAVIATARDLGIEAVEARAPLEALAGSQGAFLTNSLIGVRPVASVDGASLPQSTTVERLASAVG